MRCILNKDKYIHSRDGFIVIVKSCLSNENTAVIDILAFIDNEPPKIIRASTYRTGISYLCRDGKVWGMTVQIVFATYLNGASGAILVVSDRFVLLDEILCAHQALTGCRNVRQRKASVSS